MFDAVFHTFNDGVGSERRTAHAAYQGGLTGGDLFRQHLDRVLADTDRFFVGTDFNFGDLRLAERHCDRYGPRNAGVGSCVGARRVGESAGRENNGGSDNGILAEVHESLLGPVFNSRHTGSMPADLRE